MGGMANSTDSDSKGRIFINGRNGIDMFDPSELNRRDVAYPGWYQFQQHTPGNGTTYGFRRIATITSGGRKAIPTSWRRVT